MSGFWTVQHLKILETSGPKVMSGRALGQGMVLTLSQPLGGTDYAHHTTVPLGFLDISTALCFDMLSSAALL